MYHFKIFVGKKESYNSAGNTEPFQSPVVAYKTGRTLMHKLWLDRKGKTVVVYEHTGNKIKPSEARNSLLELFGKDGPGIIDNVSIMTRNTARDVILELYREMCKGHDKHEIENLTLVLTFLSELRMVTVNASGSLH